MKQWKTEEIPMRPRIQRLKEALFAEMPQIEADRAVLLTEAYRQTENLPIIERRAKAFSHILRHIPIVIRDDELIVGSNTQRPRSSQAFPEFSYAWLESELDTIERRSADPFYISEETKLSLREVFPYWKGRTTSDLAESYMSPETRQAIADNVFTPGNYFYNGVGHVTVDYGKVLSEGLDGIVKRAKLALDALCVADGDYAARHAFLCSVIESCHAVCEYALRYSELAAQMAKQADPLRAAELRRIAENCARVPAQPARDFWEACQSFWFIQQLLQMESSGHSISPGRFDQYMYPYLRKDIDAGNLHWEEAQELVDCVWVKLNDLNKARDAASSEGFAGYSLFQNLCIGGQAPTGLDATNDLSFLCVTATMHVHLPQPSFSVRVWNGSPQELLLRCAELTRTGIGFPAYYNDEVIIPALLNRGLRMEDALDYNIIGCVEPQKAGKTEGWHDAAFYNMLKPLESLLAKGENYRDFEDFLDAYKEETEHYIKLLVNADNAIDAAHAGRCPLPFLSSMVEDCIGRGKSVQEGGAVYNFTGPQGFGVANLADSLYAIRELVYTQGRYSLDDFREAIAANFGEGIESVVENIVREVLKVPAKDNRYRQLREEILALPKFGNDIGEVDMLAREAAYTYSRPLEKFRNPRGGQFQAGLYPVSANVPLGAQTGATPDGRLSGTPIADGVSPASGRDVTGPTAAANSVAKLDHAIASNGTLFNQKFHPSALAGQQGLENFVALIRAFFDQKGSHVQFNVVSRDTLLDAQAHPENYRGLVVRVAGYSALFTSLSKSLQDDIIQRTEHIFR